MASSDRKFPEATRFFRMANEVRPMQADLIIGWVQALPNDFDKPSSTNTGAQGWYDKRGGLPSIGKRLLEGKEPAGYAG